MASLHIRGPANHSCELNESPVLVKVEAPEDLLVIQLDIPGTNQTALSLVQSAKSPRQHSSDNEGENDEEKPAAARLPVGRRQVLLPDRRLALLAALGQQ